jgi:hypothetical protein
VNALPPLLRVALAGLFPVALVLAGLLESPDLLLALAVEAALLCFFAGLQAAFSSVTGAGSPVRLERGTRWQDELDGGLGRLLLAAAGLCVGGAGYAALQVRWDWQSGVGIVAVLGYALAGVWRSSWQAGDLLPHGLAGLLWRLAVVAVGFLVFLPLSSAVGDLSGSGWSTAYDGTGGLPVLPGLSSLLVAGPVAPEMWPALLLLLLRGADEVGFAAWRLAGPDPAEADATTASA